MVLAGGVRLANSPTPQLWVSKEQALLSF